MSSSSIRAGAAYVEVTTNDSKLLKGLAAGMKRVREFGGGLESLGVKMGVLGGAITGPIILAAKEFASAGESMQKMRDQTGLGVEALNALNEAARAGNIPVESIASSVKNMQKNLVSGSKASVAAFAKLGLSAEKMKKQSPEATLRAVADRLDTVTDANERVAIAQAIFGRSGVQMISLLRGGSAGMDANAAAAHRLGTAFTDDTLKAALKLDDEFDNLEGAFKGFGRSIAGAVAGPLGDMVRGLSNALQIGTAWVKQNPEQVQSLLNMAIGLTAVGTGFVVLGAAIQFALLPSVMIAGVIAVLVVSLLALTDSLGITSTGFGKMADSIRISGTGLGTWFSVLSTWIGKQFNYLWQGIEQGWDALWNGLQNGFDMFASAMDWTAQTALEVFKATLDGAASALNAMVALYNSTLGKLNGKTISAKFTTPAVLGGMVDGFQSRRDKRDYDNANRNADYVNGRDDKAALFEKMREVMDKKIGDMFIADQDAHPNSPVNGLDTAALKDAFASMGKDIGDLLKSFLPTLPDLPQLAAAGVGGASGIAPSQEAVGKFMQVNLSRQAVTGVNVAADSPQVRLQKEANTIAKQTLEAVKENNLAIDND